MGFLNIFYRKKQIQELEDKKTEVLKPYRKQQEENPSALIDTETSKELEKVEAEYSELKLSEEELTRLRADVHLLLASHKRQDATEKIAQEFSLHHTIKTIRSDKDAEMWVYCEGIYIPKGKTYVLEWCRAILSEAYTTQICNEVIAKVQTDTFIDSKEFFSQTNPNEIPLENGIFNLETKRLTYFDDKKIFFNKLPITFDGFAICDNIKKHFETVLEHPKTDILVIQELFGYLLLKNYKYEKAFMFLGTGRNGKGKTLLLMEHFLGKENCVNIALQDLDKNNFAKAELFGKLANLGGDLSATALKETGNFKQVTGGDLLSADRKFKESITFQNHAKMIFCANELPKTYDDTYAFFSRWIMFNFPYTFVTKQEYDSLKQNNANLTKIKIADQELINKLTTKDELSGLFNWALIGLERLEQQKGFSVSQTTEQVQAEWTRKSDSFSAFFMDCLEMTTPDLYVEKKVLSNAYTKYCKERGLKQENRNHINLYLQKKGASEDRIKIKEEGEVISQPYVFFGIKFIDESSVSSVSSRESHPIQNFIFPIDTKTIELSELTEPQNDCEDIKDD